MGKYKYYISVGEPWNFVGPDGENIIKGDIIRQINDNLIVFKSNNLIDFSSIDDGIFIKGDVFILTPRYTGLDFSNYVDDLVVVNGTVLNIEYNEKLTEVEIRNNVKAGIIGSLERDKGR